ncbi:hypothetical protein FA95DRAFT_1612891 [Auriscalpium vulgare]|uniref:Uncharacterized protein n=1 Tax=Auriscalpium vulgare TaxID=40419 RepID=A0ACB8R635_9AGAM|nr:hypothetical protein FA95DRAFT_1612891 [Auriscalpium vulgare]
MAHHGPVYLILAQPGHYVIDFGGLPSGAQPAPWTNAGASFAAGAPAFATPTFAPAFPPELATPTVFPPAFATGPGSPSARALANTTGPASTPVTHAAPALPTTTFRPASGAHPVFAAPAPTPFFVPPAFLTGALPSAAADALAGATAAFVLTEPASVAPRTPPPSPTVNMVPAPPPNSPVYITAPAPPADVSSEHREGLTAPRTPGPVQKRAGMRRAKSSPALNSPSPAAPVAWAKIASEDEGIPLAPLTPAPVHRRHRAPSESPPPLPTSSPPKDFRLKLSPFGGANAILRGDAVELLEL